METNAKYQVYAMARSGEGNIPNTNFPTQGEQGGKATVPKQPLRGRRALAERAHLL